MWFFKDHPLSRRRAQSLMLCKEKAPPQHQLAPPSQKEGKQNTGRETELLSTSKALEVVPSRLGAGATFITSTCCCLSLFRQASTFSLSPGRLERKKRHREQSLQCISLYNLQYIWNYFCEFMLLLYLLTLLWKYIFLQLFQKNIESIYPSKIKYRRERRNSYRSCL